MKRMFASIAGSWLLSASTMAASAATNPFEWEIGGDLNAIRGSTEIPVFAFVGGEFVQIDTQEVDSEFDAVTLTATRYFRPVDAADGPLARAAFLDRASSVTARLGGSESESDNNPGGSDSRAIGFDLQLVSAGSGWLVSASLDRSRQDADPFTFRTRFATLAAGRYIGERAAIRIGAQRFWARADSDLFGVQKINGDTLFAELELLGDLGAEWDYALDVTARLPESGSDAMTLAIRGALFPTATLELGADLEVFTANPTSRDRRYGVFARWFVDDAWSTSLRIATRAEDLRSDADEDFVDVTLGVRYRF